jgi:asparagine synthase (glutamine-hydrolysing)
MCGIVGALAAVPVETDVIAAMRDRLVHRGPDHGGLWRATDGRVCFGHRRLAIIDLSPQANQPFLSSDGRFVITFNGEIYNFQALQTDLKKRGACFRTRSDTEVLLEAYRYWGEECLARLSGMFAFAIWDTVEQRLFCARDRAGEKPFYYAVFKDCFLFASELKALLAWPDFPKKIHYPALVDYLSFGFVADPKTIWEGCRKLPPGHWMSVEMGPGGKPNIKEPAVYWDLEFRPDPSVVDWGPTIRSTLEKAAKEMAIADVPVGAFLSGGVDSSSVTAALSRAGFPVEAFTVGFREDDYDERPWAREVAKLYSVPHSEIVVSANDIAPVFEKLLWHYDEPFNDYSYLPTFYLCREARKSITVALSGDGGDELFAGYRKYQRLALRQQIQRLLPPPVGHALVGLSRLLPSTQTFQRKLLQYGLNSHDVLADTLNTGLRFRDLRAAARGPLAQAVHEYTPADTVRRLLANAPPEQVGLINSMRYLDFKLTLAGDILVKVDRASMAVSLEVRPVYLHSEMLDLVGRIPPRTLADRAQGKRVLKNALRHWLPDSLLFRMKMGFAMPLKKWIGTDLGALFPGASSPSPLDDLMDQTVLETAVNLHSSGKADLTYIIHSLFFLKLWLLKWA